MFFVRGLVLRIFYFWGIRMYEDVDHIEDMTYQEYKQVIYYFNHPKEYKGDFISFRDKVVEYASRKESAVGFQKDNDE